MPKHRLTSAFHLRFLVIRLEFSEISSISGDEHISSSKADLEVVDL